MFTRGGSSSTFVVEELTGIGKNQTKNFHTDNGFISFHQPTGGCWGCAKIENGVFTRLDNDSSAGISYNSSTQVLSMYQTYANSINIMAAYNDLDA